MMRTNPWMDVVRTAAALAAAMGIGRFAYTPILPLMTAHAGLSPQGAGQVATANYVGYLVGAVAGACSPRLSRSVTAYRASLAVLSATLLAMPMTTNVVGWMTIRLIAGISSALVFIIAINMLLDVLHHRPQLPGWAFGGVGLGIALSAVVVLALPRDAGWQAAWWWAAAAAAPLSVLAWPIRSTPPPEAPKSAGGRRDNRYPFALLFAGYTLEGVGYIIAGTFLVAALAQHSPGRLGAGAWLVAGAAAIPSAALWSRLSSRYRNPSLLTAALLLQAAGITLACTGISAAALVGAVLFGATFIGVSILALAHGRLLRFPGAVALLTAGYSVGQIAGPVVVAPLTHHGFRPALAVGAVIVLLAAALTALLMRITGGQPDVGAPEAEVADPAGERLDHGAGRRPVVVAPPDQ